MRLKRVLGTAAVATLLAVGACGGAGDGSGNGESEDRPHVAFITNGVANFWLYAKAGAEEAGREFGVECEVMMPPSAAPEEQQRFIEGLLTRGVDGISISPIDGVNQVQLLDEAAQHAHVITNDSDAPDSKRLCYVGMDNYKAGRECGKLVKEALPDGGEIMLFVGRLEQDNARRRRQGVIDELLDRPFEAGRYDPPDAALQGERYTVLDTRTDGFDFARAKANAEDAIARYPELDCMVGLFEYNPPNCLEALRGAGKLGEIQVVAFDENFDTLQGILDGHVYGSVLQQPYQYGYQSVEILSKLARGDDSAVPEDGYVEVPPIVVRKDNAQATIDRLKKLLETGDRDGNG